MTYKISSGRVLSDLGPIQETLHELTIMSMSNCLTDEDYDKKTKAEAYLNEIDELDSELYSDYTIRFINKSTLTRLKNRGFYPGKYDGDFVKAFDVYDLCIPNYEEDYLVYLSDYRDI